MNIINLSGEIYVQISFLEKYGLNSQTIYNGLSRNRKKNNRSYEHFADPKDNRVKWIKYLSVPKQTMEKYKLPSLLQLTSKLEEDQRTEKEELIHRCLHYANERGYYNYKKYYHGTFHDSYIIDQYARTHAVFCSALDLKNNDIKIKDIFIVYCSIHDLVFNTNSLKSFYHKLRDFEQYGYGIFIHKSYGKSRSWRRVSEEHIKKIELLYRDTKIYSGREIHQKLNSWAIEKGHFPLSISTVKKILSSADFKNRNKGYRYGKEWVFNNFEPFTLRLDPENNGTLWQIDGSRLQIPYLGENNQPKFLILFVVMDVHSRKIVGFSFGKSETHQVAIQALKMAVKNTRYVPKELLRDNGSCFKHTRFKELEEHFKFLGTYVRRHKVGLARDKAHVERFFSTFQTTILNKVKGYIGEGVKSRREEGRPAKEVIEESLKPSQLRTLTELEKLIPTLIDKYNNQKIYDDQHSPWLRYEIAGKDLYTTHVTDNEFSLMFWDKATIRVNQSMILMSEGKHRNRRFQYIIEEHDLRCSLNLTTVQVYYQKSDRSLIKLFDENLQWITDLKLSEKVSSVKPRKVKKRKKRLVRMDEIGLKSIAKKAKKKISKNNQLFKQPATLDTILTKTKNNE